MIPIGKRYNTPHRSHVVKTRMTKEEYADFTERLKNYDMSQAEFIRQAIARATIRPIVTVSPVNDELLSAVGKLIAEYGKIGGNLNQIARALNEYGTPYNTLSVEVRAAISDLAALKFEVLRKVGDAVGNIQAYNNVFLSDTELDELKAELPDKWEYYIDRLSTHIASKGTKYRSHAATIYKWAQEDEAKKPPKKGIPDYTFKEGESL